MANGDITYTNPGGEMDASAFASGSYIGLGTAGAIDILCGFTPSKIVLKNRTSKETCEWTSGMTATYVWLTIADGTRTLVQLGSSGVDSPIVLTAALSSAGQGFRVPVGSGAATEFNTAAEIVDWEAWR